MNRHHNDGSLRLYVELNSRASLGRIAHALSHRQRPHPTQRVLQLIELLEVVCELAEEALRVYVLHGAHAHFECVVELAAAVVVGRSVVLEELKVQGLLARGQKALGVEAATRRDVVNAQTAQFACRLREVEAGLDER